MVLIFKKLEQDFINREHDHTKGAYIKYIAQ